MIVGTKASASAAVGISCDEIESFCRKHRSEDVAIDVGAALQRRFEMTIQEEGRPLLIVRGEATAAYGCSQEIQEVLNGCKSGADYTFLLIRVAVQRVGVQNMIERSDRDGEFDLQRRAEERAN